MILSPALGLGKLACQRPATRCSSRMPAAVSPVQSRRTIGLQQQRQQQQQALLAPPQASSSGQADAGEELVPDTEFSITKISYGSILTPLGIFLLAYGFGAFFQLLPGADVSPLLLIYGFPISLLGFALAYAQLPPVPCKTTKAAFDLRATQMTDIQKQIREDTTRYRYGDELHLDEALDKIFKFGRGSVPRRLCPILKGLREEVVEGMYALILEFESSIDMSIWEEKQPKIQSFFGPGIVARVTKVSDNMVEVELVSDGSGAGRDGKTKADALPPLMPGLKPRQQS
uniref:Uncharacterized protein n=1 Tax=Dunaliella tertiolecta TaxID=3047 RepID=A0A7S3VUY5_DUNTE|mmetsp:Transcript_23029/g.63601  ORF Transcript_23029/g.63601 Transcript_23029/m.63601 type:complete len:287 (+) Transcript_23029:138-998(+)|eukprot:CAMPEP_0202348454 /NCGR_PEP_ID=MMETSP1126-20121109/6373_1 /ASSEMBLY_ACC=CAM_ASM_000457 /TAXON_ID=3047 /ORGANISM="Dunaliella tertiolecta, Strain CCMP1320" /LENGTH=286 /DNA_ID=CAMNT_0048940135 /DNA_START=99 /DNA_END=959 /DNA_ORIENTATION=-